MIGEKRKRDTWMKRSEINEILRAADDFVRSLGCALPPFAQWSPEEMRARRASIDAIVDGRLGWDITDFGQDRFDKLGLALFTLRNGSEADLSRGGGMCYAEKLIVTRHDQAAPMHRHILKTADIINRGGATLALKLFESNEMGGVERDAPLSVVSDGVQRPMAAGEILRLAPGESVTLPPSIWRAYWGEDGDVLVGEVSTVNNDLSDNIFSEPIGRFAEVEEDEAPLRLLVSDYPAWLPAPVPA
jgi:D-lyxose ketol-isomerase